MENGEGFSELESVPEMIGVENGGFEVVVDSDDVGLNCSEEAVRVSVNERKMRGERRVED